MSAAPGLFAGAFLLLVLGAVMACLEASLVALPEARIRAMRDEMGEGGRLLERYLADPGRALSRLLAGRVLAPIAATTVVMLPLVERQARWWVLSLVALGIAFVYGLFVEVAVTIGRRRARAIAPRALVWMRPLALSLAPFAAPIGAAGRWVSSKLTETISYEPMPVTEKEVEYVVEEAQSSGAVDPMSSQMLQNVFGLKSLTAREIMVPRTRVVAMEVSTSLEDAVRMLSEEGLSRVPVYRQQIDNVVGVLFAKDLFRAATTHLSAPPGESSPQITTTVESIMRKPVFFVSDGQPILSVLRGMQTRRVHLAVVVDEFGAVIGILTLEDILEELVGEIEDEDDRDEAELVTVSENRWLASAAMSLSVLGEKLDVEFPEGGDYTSLGGFLAARAGKVPDLGTVVVWEGLRFIVREGDKRKAIKVEIVRDPRRSSAPVSSASAE
jgi:CBS domain containing-hemolysin-like protein